MSPGWHSSTLQIASSVENRIAFAFPVFRIDRFASVMSTASDNSVSDICRRPSIASRLTVIGMAQTVPSNSSRIAEPAANTRLSTNTIHRYPTDNRDRVTGCGRTHGRVEPAEKAGRDVQQLQREKCPSDRPQPVRIRHRQKGRPRSTVAITWARATKILSVAADPTIPTTINQRTPIVAECRFSPGFHRGSTPQTGWEKIKESSNPRMRAPRKIRFPNPSQAHHQPGTLNQSIVIGNKMKKKTGNMPSPYRKTINSPKSRSVKRNLSKNDK